MGHAAQGGKSPLIAYLRTAQVALMLGTTKRTLSNWVKAGKVPAPLIDPKTGYMKWTLSDVEVARSILRETVKR